MTTSSVRTTLLRAWTAITSGTLDALIPRRCGLCGRFDTFLCDACAAGLLPASPPRCAGCWGPLQLGARCRTCAAQLTQPLRGMRAAYRMEGDARALVHLVKYDGRFAVAEPMGQLMAAALARWGIRPDAVVAVPLHRVRQRQRGFNQAHHLARACAEASDLPLLTDALQRTRHTAAQVRVGGSAARQRNISGAFVAQAEAAGRRILVIDDVTTTGATLRACAEALRAAGAREVYALTWAKED